MNKNISLYVVISNSMFYAGMLWIIYLFMVDDNTPRWLFAIILLIIGMIGSAIPDVMVNIGIENMNITIIRITLIIKEAVFCITYVWLTKYFYVVLFVVTILFAVDVFLETILIRQVYETKTAVEEFVKRLNEFDTSIINKNMKYIVGNIFMVLVFLKVHESKIECSIILAICLLVHAFTLEKMLRCITGLGRLRILRIRILLWGVEFLMLTAGYLNQDMLVYWLVGTYYMVITDILQERKTSIVKTEYF